jgi:hypothetical protein
MIHAQLNQEREWAIAAPNIRRPRTGQKVWVKQLPHQNLSGIKGQIGYFYCTIFGQGNGKLIRFPSPDSLLDCRFGARVITVCQSTH